MAELKRLTRHMDSREVEYSYQLLRIECDTSLAKIRQLSDPQFHSLQSVEVQTSPLPKCERLVRERLHRTSSRAVKERPDRHHPISGELNSLKKALETPFPRRDRRNAREAPPEPLLHVEISPSEALSPIGVRSQSVSHTSLQQQDNVASVWQNLSAQSSFNHQDSSASIAGHPEASDISGASSPESSRNSSISSARSSTFQSILPESSFAPPTFLSDIDSRPSHTLSMASSLASGV